MKDQSKTKQVLIQELASLRQRIAALEQSKSEVNLAEQMFHKGEAQYRRLFEGATLGIFQSTPEGKVISVNPEFARMFGFESPDDVIITINNVATAFFADPERRSEIMRLMMETTNLKTFENQYRRKDGSTFTGNLHIWPVRDADGHLLHLEGFIEDITKRKQAEEALRESEERYHDFFTTSRDCVFITSPDGWLIDFNDAALEMFGYDNREEFSHVPISSRYAHSEDRSVFLNLIVRDGYVKEFPVQLKQRDGTVIDSLITGVPLRNPDGTIKALVGTARDITERKRAEEALRKSEERYRFLFDAVPVGIAISDLEGNMYGANRSIQEITGYTLEEFKTIKSSDTYADLDERTQILQVLREFGRVRNYEVRVKRKDGTVHPVRLNIDQIEMEGQRVLLTAMRDITDLKRAEEALRESEEKYRNLVENVSDVIYEIDSQGVVIYISPVVRDIMGYDQADIVGKNYIELVYEDDQSHIIERFFELREGIQYPTEYRLISKSGDIRWVRTKTSPIMEGGRFKGARGTLIDITERKRAEEEKRSLEERLQRAEKMEALGMLAGGVAHDLNNVLGIVVGYSEMLLMEVDKSSPLRHSLENIMSGGQMAAAIVGDLLTLARRGVADRKILSLNKIITDNQKSPEFANLSFHHSSVKIKTDLEPDLLHISGSSVHLGKSLFNLVSNASEAMPKGGILTIKTANQYLDRPIQGYDQIREGDYVVLSVSDTGEGIHEADLKRIFEPFYTKKVMGRSGTGLGLAVVWGTVKDHNGYINVQSEIGKGSIFTLYFPVTREDISFEAVAVSISEYLGRGESILVVDDVKGQRDLAAGMLRKLNYSVTIVSSGEEAIAYLKDHQADLIVLDMIMDPGMDGLDTYRNVLEIHPQQKAIIVSGFSESDRVHDAQALGAGAYVRKPYVIEKLGLAVRKELDRST